MDAITTLNNLVSPTVAAKEARLKEIETRIGVCLRSAYERIVEVGRYLNTVKAEKLVPHGRWEAWLSDVTGMDVRQAQRWMQIAREVPEGSYLSRLEISKMRMILALPEAEREPIAQKAAEEGLDVKALKKEIAAQRARAEKAEAEIGNMAVYVQREDRRVKELEQRLNEAQSATQSKGISAEAAAQIEKLRTELDNAREFGRVQAEKRKQAQDELLTMKQSQAARGSEEKGGMLSGDDMLAAAKQFIQIAGVMPHMGREFSRMRDSEKRPYEQALEMIRQWLGGARRAVGAVEGVVVEG